MFCHFDVFDELLIVAKGKAVSRQISGMTFFDVALHLFFRNENVVASGITKPWAVGASKTLSNPEPFKTLGEFLPPNSYKIGRSFRVIPEED